MLLAGFTETYWWLPLVIAVLFLAVYYTCKYSAHRWRFGHWPSYTTDVFLHTREYCKTCSLQELKGRHV